MKHLLLAALACAALALAACKSTEGDSMDSAGMQTANTMCPMMPDHEVDPEVTTTYEGQTVGFCCSDCVPKWNALSDEQKEARLNAVGVDTN